MSQLSHLQKRMGRQCGTALLALAVCLTVNTVAVADTRVVKTAYGAVTVEGTPERVVTLYEGALDAALAAGVKPLAAVATRGGTDVARYIAKQAGDVAIVGTSREINLETVVTLKPDLILASSRLPRREYELLSRIAPTIVPEQQGFDPDAWKAEALLFGKALGRRDRVVAVIDRIEQRAADLARQVKAKFEPDDRLTYLIRWMPQGALVMSSSLFSTGMLAAAGFDVSDGGLVDEGRPHSNPLSLENLVQVDGDWLFLATLNQDGRKALAAAKQSPAFSRLNVVGRDRVIPVDGQLWTSASGPLAAQAVLDAIEALVLQSRQHAG